MHALFFTLSKTVMMNTYYKKNENLVDGRMLEVEEEEEGKKRVCCVRSVLLSTINFNLSFIFLLLRWMY